MKLKTEEIRENPWSRETIDPPDRDNLTPAEREFRKSVLVEVYNLVLRTSDTFADRGMRRGADAVAQEVWELIELLEPEEVVC